jgi:VanZ family protein
VKPTVLRLTLLCYGILLIGIILIANRGGGHFWHFLTDLPLGDKAGHLGLVGTLSLLLNLSLKGRRAPRPLSGIMLGSLLVAIVMTAEECSQAFFPSRTLDLFDGLANLAGVTIGEIAARLLLRPKITSVVTS